MKNEKQQEQPSNAGMPTVDTGMQIAGSYEERTPLTLDQRKQQTQDWYKKEYGYIPSSFNQIWAQQHPESTFKTITAPNGMAFYSDGKGEWKPMPHQTLTPTEQEAMLKTKGRELNNTELFPNTGIRASGMITGDKVDEVKKDLSSAANALQQIKELKQLMTNNTGKSFSPEQRAKAQKYVAFLQSAVRPMLFPSGRVAEWEQNILNRLVANPTDILSLDSSSKASLDLLEKQVQDNLTTTATNHGVSISYSTAQNRISSLASQARLAKRIGQ